VRTRDAKTKLLVVFVFSTAPRSDARIRTRWYYNNKEIGFTPKKRGTTVSSSVSSDRRLPNGYWRCALEVKLGGSAWRAVKEARIRLR
jgi:hypothetical protein